MTSVSLKEAPTWRLSVRAATVTAAYLGAALTVLVTVTALRAVAPPATVSRFLGFVLIASLGAGLEPGTVRAAAIGAGGIGGASPAAYLASGGLKALAASLAMAPVWRFADPGVSLATLLWTPALAVAGFWATDLRARLDLAGRHAAAIAVKQGSLSGGFVLAGALVALGLPLSGAIGISCVVRLGAVGLAAIALGGPSGAPATPGLAGQVGGLLADRRWIDMAAVSAIAAASGGADRLFGLRFLSPVAYGGYYLTYEVFSRFWLLPYLLTPILFARRTTNGAGDGFVRAAWRIVALVGAAYIAATALVVALAPGLLRLVTGASFGSATVAFALAVVLNSFSQLRVAELQGAGHPRRAALAIAIGAAVAIPTFFLAARFAGAAGLMMAWLAKSVVELGLLTAAGARLRDDAGPRGR